LRIKYDQISNHKIELKIIKSVSSKAWTRKVFKNLILSSLEVCVNFYIGKKTLFNLFTHFSRFYLWSKIKKVDDKKNTFIPKKHYEYSK
jgi:hypothetical protein